MKTELRVVPHKVLPDQSVFEIWYDGKLLGTVTGADGPGVRIISKYQKSMLHAGMFIEVRITPS